jgi:hypothetical protein
VNVRILQMTIYNWLLHAFLYSPPRSTMSNLENIEGKEGSVLIVGVVSITLILSSFLQCLAIFSHKSPLRDKRQEDCDGRFGIYHVIQTGPQNPWSFFCRTLGSAEGRNARDCFQNWAFTRGLVAANDKLRENFQRSTTSIVDRREDRGRAGKGLHSFPKIMISPVHGGEASKTYKAFVAMHPHITDPSSTLHRPFLMPLTSPLTLNSEHPLCKLFSQFPPLVCSIVSPVYSSPNSLKGMFF